MRRSSTSFMNGDAPPLTTAPCCRFDDADRHRGVFRSDVERPFPVDRVAHILVKSRVGAWKRLDGNAAAVADQRSPLVGRFSSPVAVVRRGAGRESRLLRIAAELHKR